MRNIFKFKNNKILESSSISTMNTLSDTSMKISLEDLENETMYISIDEIDSSAELFHVGHVIIKKPNSFLANAFSLQMLEDLNATIKFEEVDSLPFGLDSAIGHQDTANVLGMPMNRISIKLKKGDILYIAQLTGGRLPEGSTSLPEGYSFKLIKATVL